MNNMPKPASALFVVAPNAVAACEHPLLELAESQPSVEVLACKSAEQLQTVQFDHQDFDFCVLVLNTTGILVGDYDSHLSQFFLQVPLHKVLVVVLNDSPEEVSTFCSRDRRLRSLTDAERVIRMTQLMGTTTSDKLESLMDELPALFRRSWLRAKNLNGRTSYLTKDVIMTVIVASVLVAMIAVVGRYVTIQQENTNLNQKITDAEKVADEHRKQADEIKKQADEHKKQAVENQRLHQQHLKQSKMASVCSLRSKHAALAKKIEARNYRAANETCHSPNKDFVAPALCAEAHEALKSLQDWEDEISNADQEFKLLYPDTTILCPPAQ